MEYNLSILSLHVNRVAGTVASLLAYCNDGSSIIVSDGIAYFRKPETVKYEKCDNSILIDKKKDIVEVLIIANKTVKLIGHSWEEAWDVLSASGRGRPSMGDVYLPELIVPISIKKLIETEAKKQKTTMAEVRRRIYRKYFDIGEVVVNDAV